MIENINYWDSNPNLTIDGGLQKAVNHSGRVCPPRHTGFILAQGRLCPAKIPTPIRG